jgi:large conductance mechanosensitive channel
VADGTNPKEGPKGLLAEFKDFIMRGNVVDLAVAVVIGTAFGLVIKAFVTDILTPIVAAIFGKPNFETLTFTINHSQFLFGDLINNVIDFLAIAAAIFFVVVKPLNVLAARRARGQVEPDSTERPCPACLSSVPKAATRCAYCTGDLETIG